MLSARVWFLVLGFLSLVFFLSPQLSYAQTSNSYPATTSSANPLSTPNMDPEVPRNQHTLAQSVTIEVLSAVMCQLTGIDPIDSSVPCLGINPVTHRLGYAPQGSQNPTANGPQMGGLIGITTNMIASTYTPVVTTGVYTQYLSDNFGIVKTAHAASSGPSCGPTTSYGFCGLGPIFNLWIAVRNISYGLLVFAFLFMGIGIMLRVKIDPRTVMSIQNQIPKVIIAIILITFSYAISALMIDLMWVTTYAGINLIVNANPEVSSVNTGGGSLAVKSTRQLLDLPFFYVNDVFHTKKAFGIAHITDKVSGFMGTLIEDVTKNILGVSPGNKCFAAGKHKILFGLGPALPHIDFQACIGDVFGWIASIVAELIIFIALIIALFKIWFNLLKAYIYTLFYIIISPIYIVFGLLPTKPLGFEAWLRRFFANIAIFPITAFIIVAARLLMDIYDSGAPGQFIPPLLGHNATLNFGSILAFGAILIAPNLQTILREKMGVKQIGTPGIFAAGLAGGAAVVGAPVGKAMKHLNRYDPRTQDIGALAQLKRSAGEKGIKAAGHIPGFGSASKRALLAREELKTKGEVRDINVKKNELSRSGFKKYVKEEYRAHKEGKGSSTPRTRRQGRVINQPSAPSAPTNPTPAAPIPSLNNPPAPSGKRGKP